MSSPQTQAQSRATRMNPSTMILDEVPEDGVTNIAKTKDTHEFSGKTCEIKLYSSGDKSEDRTPFFGLNNYTCRIRRDTWVRVPVEMADHINTLVTEDLQADPEYPDDRSKDSWVPRLRFPHQRRGG